MIILKIVGLIVLWLVLGFVINFIFYAGSHPSEVGKSDTAKFLHILLNIGTVLAIVNTIIS